MSSKLIASACLVLVFGTTTLLAVSPGSNTYLPPNKGYNYNKPTVAFPQPTTRPTTPYRPNPQPSYGPPTPPPYQPKTPYQPQTPYQPGPNPPHQGGEDHHHHVPGMPFDFAYAVNDVETSNDYSHKAASDGDVTRGEYRVQLPDGRTQIVRYTADWKTGFHADVSYEGEARYPEGPFGGQGKGGYKY